jgi:hypothetical protein
MGPITTSQNYQLILLEANQNEILGDLRMEVMSPCLRITARGMILSPHNELPFLVNAAEV